VALSLSKGARVMRSGEADVRVPNSGRDTLTRGTDRSYQRLANEIAQLISRGELAANDRLPSERILADRFGVSRTSIEKQLSRWK